MRNRFLPAILVAALATNVLSAAPATAAVTAGPVTNVVGTLARVDQTLVDDLASVGADGRVIAYVHGATHADAVAALASTSGVTMFEYPEVGVLAALVSAQDVADLRVASGVTFLEGEVELVRHLISSQRAIRNDLVPMMMDGAPVLDGAGTAVAVIDTGIDGDHPMFLLEGADTPQDVTDDVTKVKRQLAWSCGVFPFNLDVDEKGQPVSTLAYDANDLCLADVTTKGGTKNDTASQGGHGTHVASTAAGLPMLTSDGFLLQGVAPGATLIDLAVEQGATFLGANNAMAYVLRHQRSWCAPEAGPNVDAGCDPIMATNHSYGPQGGAAHSPNSIANKLARAMINKGMTIAWAAGNDGGNGSASVTNGTPKERQPGIMMVASYDDLASGSRDGLVSSFSSRGASADPSTWPDISAPGSNITAACAVTLAVCRGLGPLNESADVNAGTISGTSMASPHIAGAIAVVQQAALAADGAFMAPADVEALFKRTALPFKNGAAYVEPNANFRGDHFDVPHAFDKGVGLLDLAAAVAEVTGYVDQDTVSLTVDSPVDGSTSTSGLVNVTGRVAHVVPKAPLPTETSRSFDDADDDATGDHTEILDVNFEVTDTHVVSVTRIKAVWPVTTGVSPVSYDFEVNGRNFSSFVYPTVRVFDEGASAYVSNANQASVAWDTVANTVTFRVSRAYLAGTNEVAKYYDLAVAANNGGVGPNVVDDRAPNGKAVVALASPQAVQTSNNVAVMPLSLDVASAVVTFTNEGPNGNTFYTEDSTLGASDGGHTFTLPLTGPSDVDFSLTWTDGSDLDLYANAAGVAPSNAGATGNPREVVALKNVNGTIEILVDPYLIVDPLAGSTYTLTADVRPLVVGNDDRDGDGVADNLDACPDVAGTAANGCPDTDGDGVDDVNDRCPQTAGAGADGCPIFTTERVTVSINGVAMGSDDVDTSLGQDTYSVALDLPEGTFVLDVAWIDGNVLQTSRSVTFTHTDDDDGDGVTNANDKCEGFDDNIDVDDDGMPDDCDDLIDSDGDGVADDVDQCPGFDDNIDVDQDSIPDDCDLLIDSDRDGVSDDLDQCEGFDDAVDVDQDGTPDGCDDLVDADGDGVSDDLDKCPGHDDNVDSDGDGIADGCDDMTDADGDGVADDVDECPGFDDTVDTDGDGLPDGCDETPNGNGGGGSQRDKDRDGIADDVDNCKNVANADQADMDGDGRGDVCDNDIDGDWHPNGKEISHGTDPYDASSHPGMGGGHHK